MHCHRDFFRIWPPLALLLLLAGGVPARAAQPASSLYAALVAPADAQQAAQDAMREVLVRLTGARDAAADPALADIISDAQHYVQLQRRTAAGMTQVLFDAAALRAAIAAAGRSVWGPERPLLWVQLPPMDQSAADALRARLDSAAQARGLPIMFAAAAASDGSVTADAALALARRAGATAALTAQPAPASPSSLQWTLAAADTDGHWSGAPEMAIDAITDGMVQAAHELGRAPVADFNCHISGVADLPSLASVLGELRALPEISEVAVREIDRDSLLLHLRARANQQLLEHALASDRLHAAGSAADGALEYRYQAGP